MKRFLKRRLCTLLALVFLLSGGTMASAAADAAVSGALSDTAAYLCSKVQKPQVGSVGGDWAVLGLARSGCEVPDGYFEGYYEAVETYVAARGGVLHARKYTEYSRVIIALTAIGKDPADVVGYNLLTALGDYDKTVLQGINGPIWALIALDCGAYAMPQNPDAETQATRQMYVDYILSKQLSDGGFSLTGEGAADPCITAMALQALSGYTSRNEVGQAVEKALTCLSGLQAANGGFSDGGVGDSESCSQTMIALCRLGISLGDDRFVKNGNTLMDSLLSFHTGEGGFLHTSDGSSVNQMATEQAMLALTAISRASSGQSGLYGIVQTAEQDGSVWSQDAARRSLIFYYRKDAPVWSEGR